MQTSSITAACHLRPVLLYCTYLSQRRRQGLDLRAIQDRPSCGLSSDVTPCPVRTLVGAWCAPLPRPPPRLPPTPYHAKRCRWSSSSATSPLLRSHPEAYLETSSSGAAARNGSLVASAAAATAAPAAAAAAARLTLPSRGLPSCCEAELHAPGRRLLPTSPSSAQHHKSLAAHWASLLRVSQPTHSFTLHYRIHRTCNNLLVSQSIYPSTHPPPLPPSLLRATTPQCI